MTPDLFNLRLDSLTINLHLLPTFTVNFGPFYPDRLLLSFTASCALENIVHAFQTKDYALHFE